MQYYQLGQNAVMDTYVWSGFKETKYCTTFPDSFLLVFQGLLINMTDQTHAFISAPFSNPNRMTGRQHKNASPLKTEWKRK